MNRAGNVLMEKIVKNELETLKAIVLAPDFAIDWKIKHEMTALMVAASEGTVASIDTILQRDQEPNRGDVTGRTPLHYACQGGKADNVQKLLSVPGIEKDQRTDGGNTPLMLSVQSGNLYCVVHCLNAGCNPFLENGLHETAKSMAK